VSSHRTRSQRCVLVAAFFSWPDLCNQSETNVGSIVSPTTASYCSLNWLKSTSLHSVALKETSVRAASYFVSCEANKLICYVLKRNIVPRCTQKIHTLASLKIVSTACPSSSTTIMPIRPMM